MPHTFSKDGLLRFHDHVLLMNKKTNGILVFDTGDKIISSDEAYACTTSIKDNGIYLVDNGEEIMDLVEDLLFFSKKLMKKVMIL